ncbi:MAG: HAMP domain-containing protein, partial [Betaproteobacteria bacterium]|nr:HAMP domain-containing protein [Betaproteobacteria bacterium]
QQTLAEANELLDKHLKQTAVSLPQDSFGPLPPLRLENWAIADELVVQIWERDGAQVYFSHPGSRLPPRAQLGFSDVVTENGRWRVYSALERNNVVQVAQEMRNRRTLAAGMAFRTIVPLLLLLPVLGLLVWLTVGRGLRPLRQMASALAQRTPASLHALPEAGLPIEIGPLVHALNDLLARLARALEAQKAFVADAAHELRTPLAAVQLQIQLAERATSGPEREAAFAELRRGVARSTRVVQQLLTLAREEPGVAECTLGAVDLAEVARAVVAEHAALAAQKNIDLGISREEPASVTGDAEALRVMLGNLVNNAIRYTPPDGRVDVAIAAADGKAVVEIADTGPGIPEAERERVFDRFYRGPGTQSQGSGLGLAIVKSIAERHGARIDLACGPGLKVAVSFPRL